MNPIALDTRPLGQVAPLVCADDVFALEGGTAINLWRARHRRPTMLVFSIPPEFPGIGRRPSRAIDSVAFPLPLRCLSIHPLNALQGKHPAGRATLCCPPSYPAPT